MQTTDEQKPVVEEQYDQILQLRRRLFLATCVAIVSTAAFVGVSILLGVIQMADGSSSFTARQEAEMQRARAQQIAIQQSMQAQQALRAQQAAFMAQQQQQRGMAQDGTGMMGAGSSEGGGFAAGGFGAGSFGPANSATSDEAPVVAPVPATE